MGRCVRCAAGLALAAACTAPAADRQGTSDAWAAARSRMVEEQLRARGIRSPRVLDAMARVPRHLFVPEEARAEAYADHPVPIGHDQTISQPYIVAFMTEALDVDRAHRVLEIGTGSGYQAAILAELAGEVFTIEIVTPLAERAAKTLATLGYRNVHVRAGNGYNGWPEHAPYDRVMVTAAPEEVPQPLVEQLKMDGLMAIPVGAAWQELRIMQKTRAGMITLKTLPVRFVPMTGRPASSSQLPAPSLQLPASSFQLSAFSFQLGGPDRHRAPEGNYPQ